MKKILLSLFVIFTFGFYIFTTKNEDSEGSEVVIPNIGSNPSPTTTNINNNYKDGSYTGKIVDAYYGNVQVKAIIQNGKISDIKILQYPNDRRTSENINGKALPLLIRETIQAQSENIDTISGATQTSNGFRDSLKTALNQSRG